jgi:hypothetical protein
MSDWNSVRADAADRVIDRAVREIMGAEPRPGFRRRVLARLDEEPRPLWTWTRVAVAGVGALAIIMALVIARQGNRRAEDVPQVVDRQPVSVPAQPPAAPAKPTSRRSPESAIASNVQTKPRRVGPESPRSETRIVRAASLSSSMTAAGDAGVDPTAGEQSVVVDPIIIAPLSMAPLVPPQVTVRPLPAIPQIAISPTSTPR